MAAHSARGPTLIHGPKTQRATTTVHQRPTAGTKVPQKNLAHHETVNDPPKTIQKHFITTMFSEFVTARPSVPDFCGGEACVGGRSRTLGAKD